MREVIVNGKPVQIVGAAITPWIYEDEFDGADMVADIATFADKKSEPRLKALPKMLWAMAATAVYPTPIPDHISYFTQMGAFDTSDEPLCMAVIFEAMKGCFPSRKALVSQQEAEYDAKRAGAQAASGDAGVGETDAAVAD